jgi:hypothetical protein
LVPIHFWGEVRTSLRFSGSPYHRRSLNVDGTAQIVQYVL